MKKSILTFSALAATLIVSAQRIDVKESSEKFSTGSHNAFSTTIFANTQDDVESEWKKVLKDYKNEKVKSDKGEVFGDNIVIKEWGNDPVDIYTTFEEDKKAKTVVIHVAFDLGGAYITSSEHKEKAAYVQKMVKDFGIKMTKAPLAEIVKNQEKILSSLQDDQSDLEKKNKSLKSDIEDYKSKIVKAEKEVATNEPLLEQKKGEIATQKKVVDASQGAVSEQAKSSQKIHDKLTDQHKDIEKDIKKSKSDIEDYNGKIKKAEDDIKKNESDQEKKKQAIEAQKKVVDDAKKNLEKVD